MKKTFIIAEAGVNHNGSLVLAKQLVDVAAESGADAVKFQTFKAERVATRDAKKAAYQEKIADAAESQVDMLKKLELNQLAHEELFNYSRERSIEFLSTPFDYESVEMLVRLGLSRLKISSGEITNGPLLLKAASTGLP
jgi:sialic acid synthase SpsE